MTTYTENYREPATFTSVQDWADAIGGVLGCDDGFIGSVPTAVIEVYSKGDDINKATCIRFKFPIELKDVCFRKVVTIGRYFPKFFYIPASCVESIMETETTTTFNLTANGKRMLNEMLTPSAKAELLAYTKATPSERSLW